MTGLWSISLSVFSTLLCTEFIHSFFVCWCFHFLIHKINLKAWVPTLSIISQANICYFGFFSEKYFVLLFLSPFITCIFLFYSLKLLCIKVQSSICLHSTSHLKFSVKLSMSSFGWACHYFHYPHSNWSYFCLFFMHLGNWNFPMIVISTFTLSVGWARDRRGLCTDHFVTWGRCEVSPTLLFFIL